MRPVDSGAVQDHAVLPHQSDMKSRFITLPCSSPFGRNIVLASVAAALLIFSDTGSLGQETQKKTPSESRPIQEEWATPPYITLSQRAAEYVKALPVLGRVDWDLKHLDFIDDGPTAGLSGAALVHHDGALYLAGGFIPKGDGTGDPSHRTSKWAFRYDLASDRWQRLPDMPERKEYTRGIATAGGEIFVVGGLRQKATADNYSAVMPEVFRLTSTTNGDAEYKWEIHSQLGVPRTHSSPGAVGRRLILVGGNEYAINKAKGIMGMHTSTIRDTVEVFDLDKPDAGWVKKKPIPLGPRGWCGSSVLGGRFYLFGGIDVIERSDGKSTRMKLNDTLSYDPLLDSWETHAPMPFYLSGWEGATFRDRYVILIGGVEAEVVSAEKMGRNTFNDMAFAYDTVDDRWLRLDGLTPPGGVYNDPGVVIVGDRIFVVGGEGPRGSHFDHFLLGKITLEKSGSDNR